MFYETQALIFPQFSLGEKFSRHFLIWKVSWIFQLLFPATQFYTIILRLILNHLTKNSRIDIINLQYTDIIIQCFYDG